MRVEIETKTFSPTRAMDKNGEWWTLLGQCLRCGQCGCIESVCVHFTYEILNGKKTGKCKRQFEKPFMCVLYPSDPHQELKPGCGFKWEKE